MFNSKVRSQFALEQVRNTEIYRTVKQHWMQTLMVISLCFIVMKKDIQFQFNLSSSNEEKEEQEVVKSQTINRLEGKNEISPVRQKQIKPTQKAGITKAAAAQSNPIQKSEKKLNQLSIVDPLQMWSAVKEKLSEQELYSIAQQEAMSSPDLGGAVKVKKKSAKKVTKKAKAKSVAPLANNYSYLTFVLSPTYAKRKGIPQSLVDEKLNACRDYIKRFAPVAISERKKYGVPASIKLAQALLESNSGESRLARQNNNHFGIKCFRKNCIEGHCRNFTDDSHKDFFRNYENNWESYRAHSLFLQGKRYKGLQELAVTDYKAWSHGLKKAGYATDKKYAEKLIRIIEFFELDKFD